MRLFITGVSGFVGDSILRDLVGQYEVMALSDSSDSDAMLVALGATPIRGTVDIVTEHLLRGIEVLVNCAPRSEDWYNDRKKYEEQVQSTKSLLKAAAQAGVKRFIHIGTDSAIYLGKDLIDADETSPLAVNSPFPFVWTNAKAEDAVLKANGLDGMTTVILRAHMIWGPDDSIAMSALRRMVDTNSFVWINHGRARINTTHIRNLVHAVRLALRKGSGAYFITDGDTPTTHREFLPQIAASGGVTLPDRSVPAMFSRAIVFVIAALWRLLGRNDPPFFNLFMVSYVSRDHLSTCKKARSELGYEPVISREQGLAELRAKR